MKLANDQFPERARALGSGGEQSTMGGLRDDAELRCVGREGVDSVREIDRGLKEGAAPETRLCAAARPTHVEALRVLAQALGSLWGERLYRETKTETKQ